MINQGSKGSRLGTKKLPHRTISDVPVEAYFDGRIANRAIKSLRRLKKNREPFFWPLVLESESAVQRPKALLEPVRPGQSKVAGIIGQAGKRY